MYRYLLFPLLGASVITGGSIFAGDFSVGMFSGRNSQLSVVSLPLDSLFKLLGNRWSIYNYVVS